MSFDASVEEFKLSSTRPLNVRETLYALWVSADALDSWYALLYRYLAVILHHQECMLYQLYHTPASVYLVCYVCVRAGILLPRGTRDMEYSCAR